MITNPILSVAYLPPIEYCALLGGNSIPTFEKWENYQKQTYRNRTIIYSPNGPQALIIPVIYKNNSQITDVKIEYQSNWQRNHWRSITAAYNNSPFFMFYQDFLAPFYTKRFTYLFDFNIELLTTILKLIKFNSSINFTSDFTPYTNNPSDFRVLINPKVASNNPPLFSYKSTYNQVFENRFGFIPNLSIIDLLSNLGPNTKNFLESQITFYE